MADDDTAVRLRVHPGLLWLLLAGAFVRLVLLALTPGEYYDLQALARVGSAFLHAPLHVYRVNVGAGAYQGSPTYPWPYLPAFIPVAAALRWISAHLALSFSDLDRSLVGAFDLVTAAVVYGLLARLGRSNRERLGGAALIALGPAFVAVSAVHGQIDVVAWLPAVVAVGIWEARPNGNRALWCGALIGLAIAIKTTPGLLLLALAPSAHGWRERCTLVLAAAGVAAVAVLPFALVAPHGLRAIVDYRGFPGRAGLTELLQPRLALHDLSGSYVANDGVTSWLLDHTGLIVAAAVLPVAAIAWRRRLPAARTAAALVLAVLVAGPAILPQYWLWVVPFLVLANRRRAAFILQLGLLPLLVASYAFLQEPHQPDRQLPAGWVLHGYVPILWIVTLGMLAELVGLLVGPVRPVPSR